MQYKLCQIECVQTISEPHGTFNIMWQRLNRLKRIIKRRWRYLANFFHEVRHVKDHAQSSDAMESFVTVLKPRDIVRVRSREEIQATLDRWNQLKGCAFMEEMWIYCGTIQRVYKRVERFMDERDYLVKRSKGIVLLEGVICEGTKDFGQCDRSCYYFWKEEWLKKLHDPGFPSQAVVHRDASTNNGTNVMKKTNSIFSVLVNWLWYRQTNPWISKGLVINSYVRQHKKSDTIKKVVLVFIMLIAALPCLARNIIVGDNENDDFSTIQAAIDDADPADTILVKPGIYRGAGNRDLDFHGKAITVSSMNPSDPMIISATVIDCQGSPTEHHRAFIFQNNENERSIIDGLTLLGGYADKGGAVDCAPNCSPVIKNCVIRGNVAAEIDGGGINCLTSRARISNCLIENNTAEVYGGGVNCCEGSDITISNCIIRNNSSGDDGGGFQCCKSHATVTGCLFEGNISGGEGGGIWCLRPIEVGHCTIVGNRANFRGGGMTGNWDPCVITNSIIRDNLSDRYNLSNDLFLRSSVSEVSYCNFVLISEYPGVGNIDADPCFAKPGQWVQDEVDPTQTIWSSGDFHLKSQAGRWEATTQSWVMDDVTSPCIDAGDPIFPIGFEPFPNGGRVNMGAYGASDKASKTYFGSHLCQEIIAGDINGDCVVNFEDFAILASHWMMQGDNFVN